MDKKAANKAITAAAAKDYYKTMGGGRKGAAKPAKKAAPATAKAASAKAATKTAPKAKAAEAPKATAAQKKKALIRDASSKVLAGKGKEVGAARRGYIRAQQEESLRMEKTGKGSKAARRIAAAAGGNASKPSAKDSVGRFGKRLRNAKGNISEANNASIWTKRKASARGLMGSRPKSTMAKRKG
jgi:hypothetical protein